MSHEAMARRVDLVKPRVILAPENPHRPLEKPFGGPSRRVPEREQREIVRLLFRLGVPAAYAPSTFVAGRIFVAACLGLLMLIAARHVAAIASFHLAVLLAVITGAFAGWLVPSMIVEISAGQRVKAITAAMPEALDLLVICVDAGISLEGGLVRVATEMEQSRPALADEFALLSADLQILPSRDQALMRMADRVDVPSIRSVVTTLAQTLRYGTPLAQALRVISAQMRDDALIQLEERANQLPALLTVPMMLFIMPTIFLVIGGPAALQLIDALSQATWPISGHAG